MKQKEFIKYIDNRINNKTLPGIICGLYQGEEKKFEYISGYEHGKSSIFRLASMTKPITMVAVLICQQKGLLSINDNVSKYLPIFKKGKVANIVDGKLNYVSDCEREMTIIDILSHSSGIGSGEVGDFQYSKIQCADSLKEMVNIYSTWYYDFSPGKKEFYSGVVALDIVARIIEVVSKLDYFSFIYENIFEPLQMFDTFYSVPKDKKNRVVSMYHLEDTLDKMSIKDIGNTGFHCYKEGYPSGCAGLFSTYKDYLHFAKMLSFGGVYNGKQILTKESIDLIKTRHIGAWGLSVYVRGEQTEHQPLRAGSFGWSGAYSTHFWVDLSKKEYAVCMINLDNAGGSGAVTGFEFEKISQDF